MEHLTADAARWLDKPVEERIEALKKEKWVGHTLARRILEQLAHLHHHSPVDLDTGNLLIVGEPGSGKTAVMRHYAKAFQPSVGAPSLHWPILSLQLKDGPKEQVLYETILDVLKSPYPARASVKDKRCQVIHLLRNSSVKLLFIDEIHHLLLGSALQQRIFLAGLKTLANELAIPLICAGVESAHNALCLDEQVGRRFEVARLPQWSMDQEYGRLLVSFERILALKKPSNLTNSDLAFKLLGLSRGSIGRLGRILKIAAIQAVRTGDECITLQTLKELPAFPLADDTQARSRALY